MRPFVKLLCLSLQRINALVNILRQIKRLSEAFVYVPAVINTALSKMGKLYLALKSLSEPLCASQR